jgi:hypothetical protein
MRLFRHLGSKDGDNSARAETRSCLCDAAIAGVAAEIRALTARIDGFQRALNALNAIRIALEAKTWTAFQRRRSGRVAAGCARAATARRDARGRYLADNSARFALSSAETDKQ